VEDTLALTAIGGWNLLALPFVASGVTDPAGLLTDSLGQQFSYGAMYVWDAAGSVYQRLQAAPEAGQGFWAFSDDGGESDVLHGPVPLFDRELVPGWNLFGVVQDTQIEEFTSRNMHVEVVWQWDARLYIYRQVTPGSALVRGSGYWVLIVTE